MTNIMMRFFKFFSLKGCGSCSILSHYDMDMYLWY